MRESIPSWVAEYVGLEYSAVDCWALVRVVLAEQFGVFLPRHFGVALKGAISAEALIEVEDPRAGDIVVMRRGRHVGVMVTELFMLHSSQGKNVCCERVSNVLHNAAGYFRIVSRTGEEAPAVD